MGALITKVQCTSQWKKIKESFELAGVLSSKYMDGQTLVNIILNRRYIVCAHCKLLRAFI